MLSITETASQIERQVQKAIKPVETHRRCRWGKRERVIENEQVKDRRSAEFDQYSNCKLNLTGARTSHQMGKEIGYER